MPKKNAPSETTISRQSLEFDLALNAAQIGYWRLNLETLVADRSLLHDQIFGYSSLLPEWTDERFLAHVLRDDYSLVKAAIEKKAGGQVACRFHRLHDKNIGWIWVSIQFFKFEESHYRLVLVKDITTIKNNEDANKRLSSIVDSLDNAIIGKDLKGIVFSWNKGAEILYGYTKDEMIGSSIKKIIPEDSQTEFEDMLLALEGDKHIKNKELVRLCKDGRSIPVSLSASPIKNTEGTIIGVVTVACDMSEEKKMINSLLLSSQALQQMGVERVGFKEQLLQSESVRNNMVLSLAKSNQELKQMVYIASHDLQEPLRSITNFLLLIERRYKNKLDQDANDFINYAVEGAKKLQEMITDLLVYSRIETKGVRFEKTDLTTVLKDVIVLLAESIKRTKAAITYDALPSLMVDKGQMTTCFQNLISNSIKFSKAETPPKIHISVVKKADEWLFSVSDNGIGIDLKYKDQLFIMFKRLVGREYPGNGMGLALCKKVIECNGGRIWVESALGQGSVFYFTLPMMET